MDHPTGAGSEEDFRCDFDLRVRLGFHGSKISSDGGLLLFRELDEVLGLHDMAGRSLQDTRRGKNGIHTPVGLLRQSTFGRRGGYPDVNDADQLSRDPVMRRIVGGGLWMDRRPQQAGWHGLRPTFRCPPPTLPL